jgi:ABC-2 type transport system permease protein
MKKFQNLLMKEIRELVTKQLFISLAMTMALFYFIGNMAKSEVKKAAASQKIAVLDLDGSEMSDGLLANMKTMNFAVDKFPGTDKEAAIRTAKAGDTSLLLVIPAGFGASVAKFETKEIESYSFLRGFSIGGARNSSILKVVVGAINQYLSNNFLKTRIPDLDPENVKNPIKTKDFIVVKDRMAEGSAAAVYGFVSSQSFLVPVILMMIIIYSSQMVISAVAMEKQNKTLETLLTVPIRRTSIVTTKMLAAGIVGLASAVIYMFGFKSYIGGMTGGLTAGGGGVQSVIRQLGLSLTTSGYVVLGVSLFFAIICALALAMILGVMAEDFRSAQMLIMPLVFLVMIPYFISLLADFRTLSLPIKILVWAIPFSHPFLATQNIILGNTQGILFGIAYMAVFFVICVVIAARIFSTDRVLTMKLKWGKKKSAAALIVAAALTLGYAAPTAAGQGGDSAVHRGKITATMDSGGYTYVEFEENGKKVWAAGPVTKVAVGDMIELTGAMPMQDFTSKTLKKTFAVIYFAGSINKVDSVVKDDLVVADVAGARASDPVGAAGGLPKGHVPVPIKDIPAKAVAVKAGSVVKAEGGQTVAECYAQKKALNGKSVKVRGRVVKFTAEIMGKNWLHIQDGTGDPVGAANPVGAAVAGANDLTVTTSQTAAVGDLVLITGTLAADKDFGSGYAYSVIVENAALKVEEKAAKAPVKTP